MECGNTSTAPTIIQSAAARLTSKGLSSCTTGTTIPDMMGGDDNTGSLVSFFFMTSSSTAGVWTTLSIVRLFATFIIVFSIGCVCIAFFLRRRTKQILQEECGLPTVFWRPKFINYLPHDLLQNTTTATINHKNTNGAIQKKLNASNITNILPRMQRLAGPYDMYATVYGIQTKVIHVAHPMPAKLILNATRTKSPGYNHFKNFCGDGVFTADGEEWRDKRASVIHALFRSGGGIGGGNRSDRLEKECNVAASEFLKAVFIEKAENADDKIITGDGWGVIPNVVPLLQRATVGIIYRYLTHDDSTDTFQNANSNDVNSNGNKDQQSSISSTSTTCLLSTYLQSITHIRMIILAQARSIWFLLPRFCYTLFSPMFKMEEQTMIPIRAVARLACRSARPNSPLAMLQQRPSHNTSTTTIASSGSEKEEDVNKDMLDEAITLLFAGQDTSAATLSWTLHLLSLHPQIQHKLHQEILLHALDNHDDTTTTSSTSSRYISKKAASNMRYLDAVIKESMRLYPVAPFVVRMLEHDISIPPQSSSKHHPPTNRHTKLPKNSLVCIWIHALHHNPKLWKNPDRFLPERWLQSDHDPSSGSAATNDNGVGGNVPNGAYMPFATGPRNCLGQPIANIVLRVMLARILSDIEVLDPNLLRLTTTKQDDATDTNTTKGRDSMDDSYVHRFKKDMQAGFTVLPVGGVELAVRKRSVEER